MTGLPTPAGPEDGHPHADQHAAIEDASARHALVTDLVVTTLATVANLPTTEGEPA